MHAIYANYLLQQAWLSVEGSAPLSHNSIDNNEKAAAAISDVTDKEAAETIAAVSAQYGYALEHLSISEQVGAAASKNGKIKILPTLPELADFSVVPPANPSIPQIACVSITHVV